VVAVAGLACALTWNFGLLVAERFVQGLFIPALTTCVAAYLANSLPVERLNVVMGAYVSATVVGGLGGRLLGGFIHPPLHWRYAFVSAALLLAASAFAAARWLPGIDRRPHHPQGELGFRELLASWPALRLYAVAFGAFWVFSSTFNFLPFQLSRPPISASTNLITFLYLAYLVGAVMGPLAGRLANRLGSGLTMVLGALVFGVSLAGLLVPNLVVVVLALIGSCAGFFTAHAAAAGALNSRLTSSRGRGNALYVLFYYVGGACGITASGYAWRHGGWPAVIGLNAPCCWFRCWSAWSRCVPIGGAGARPRRSCRPEAVVRDHPAKVLHEVWVVFPAGFFVHDRDDFVVAARPVVVGTRFRHGVVAVRNADDAGEDRDRFA
jgi:YNFM family putative membrane transporter